MSKTWPFVQDVPRGPGVAGRRGAAAGVAAVRARRRAARAAPRRLLFRRAHATRRQQPEAQVRENSMAQIAVRLRPLSV